MPVAYTRKSAGRFPVHYYCVSIPTEAITWTGQWNPATLYRYCEELQIHDEHVDLIKQQLNMLNNDANND
jgi:hypothetical protein